MSENIKIPPPPAGKPASGNSQLRIAFILTSILYCVTMAFDLGLLWTVPSSPQDSLLEQAFSGE